MSRLFNSFLKNRFLSKWAVLLLDLVIILCSSVVSFSIVQQLYKNLPVEHPPLVVFVLIILLFSAISFLIFKTYRGVIRYSTLYEMQRIFIALSAAIFFIFIALHYSFLINPTFLHTPGSVSLAYCATFLLSSAVSLMGFRMFIVVAYQRILPSLGAEKKIAVFIFGTTPESAALRESISHGKYKVIGFVTFNKMNVSKRISNLSIVYIDRNNISDINKYSVKAILFPNDECLQDRALIDDLIAAKIKIYIAPQPKAFDDLKDPIHKQIRPIQIEDLLGRNEIAINMNSISTNVEGQNILVTGAAGSIGSEIVRQLANFNPQRIICLDIGETALNDLELELKKEYSNLNFMCLIGNVRNEARMEAIFSKYKPDIVFHAAAYKHVPMMEQNPCEAILTNVFGTKMVVDMSIKNNVKMFVMISTDKAVNPTNIMGASKRLAEIYVQSIASTEKAQNIKLVTTRFGNVLGSNGSVIPLFRKQIERGGPITVTDPEITRYFMTIPEACRLVLEASSIGTTGHIYVFDMGTPIKINDLAIRMIELAGLIPNEDIEIVYSGLRPGEKLYEELLNDGETALRTQHEKVLIAKVRKYEYNLIEPQIEKLVQVAQKVDVNETVILMKMLVPEFVSNNSIFEEFDKKDRSIS